MPSDPGPVSLVDGAPAPADLTQQLQLIHALIRAQYGFVDRVAMALYDPSTDLLKTFVSSNTDDTPLLHYQARLSEVPSLAALARSGRSRVVDDIGAAFAGRSMHSAWLAARGYRASYTAPIIQGGRLEAFLFYDSRDAGSFTPAINATLDIFTGLVARLLLLQRKVVDSLVGTIQVAVGLARMRDHETGQHLQRMAHYSRLMARALANRRGLSDEYIEYLFLFAPLHDIGKIGIPDQILLKPGRLDAGEWAEMQRHVEIGERLVEQISLEMKLEADLASQVMRNVVATHHERGDGSGYPRGLTLAQIPLEGRIVAVADVYDALTTRRPYKRAWTEAAAAAELRREVACGRLDGDCVEALLADDDARLAIRTGFAETLPEPPAAAEDPPPPAA